MRTALNSPGQVLSGLSVGASGVIAAVEVADDERGWLDAMGISVGRTATLLRRGAWGGPLHVRMDSGAEFALAVEVGDRIHIGVL